MTYPVIVMFVALAIVMGLCTFIVPKFVELFRDLGVKELPGDDADAGGLQRLPDRRLPVAHRASSWLVIFWCRFKMFVTHEVRPARHRPLQAEDAGLRQLGHKICLARFSRTLSTLLVSGVPILQAMETVAGTVGNEIISEAIMNARARIREGDRINEPLEKSKMFPPMVVHMITIGEESGALDQMLSKIAEF